MQDGALYVPPPRSRADSHARPPRQHVRTPASRTPQSHSAGARSRAATLPRQESAAASRAGTLHRQEQPLTRTGTLPRQSDFAATARTRTRPSRTASVDHTINHPMSHRPTTTGRTRSVSHGGPARTSYTYVSTLLPLPLFVRYSPMTISLCRPHNLEVLWIACPLLESRTSQKMVAVSRQVLSRRCEVPILRKQT